MHYDSDFDDFLVKGKNRLKISYRKHEINRNPKIFNVERLKEPSTITNSQQQEGK